VKWIGFEDTHFASFLYFVSIKILVSSVRGYHGDVSSVGPPCNIRLAVTPHEFIMLLMKREFEGAGNFGFRQVSPHLDSVHVCSLTRGQDYSINTPTNALI